MMEEDEGKGRGEGGLEEDEGKERGRAGGG